MSEISHDKSTVEAQLSWTKFESVGVDYHGVHDSKHCSLHCIVNLESYVLGIGTCNFEICSCHLFLLVISNIVVITFYN